MDLEEDAHMVIDLSLKTSTENHKEFNAEPLVIFIDMEKDFNKVNRNKVSEMLVACDIIDKTIYYIHDI
jgi:hypothetical protein